MREIWKKIQLRNGDVIKNSTKCTNFEVMSFGIFDEVSVSKFQPGLHLEGYGHNQ